MSRSTLGHIMAGGLLAVGCLHALGNPTGGQVVSGSATITTIPGTVTINQASNIAIINWQSFSIGFGQLTKFIQPCATSAVLNRVLGGQTSIIDGTLSANGQVLLINGNGIVVGPKGMINTNSFLASTRDISDTDLLNENLHFVGSSPNGVTNMGTINALGGDVYLIGKTVSNQGTITASNGTVGLASGDDVLLNLSGDQHVFVNPSPTATKDTTQTAVSNSGTISAASAELAAANGNMFALAINNAGTIRATTVCNSGGHVYLTTDAGMIVNNGSITAKKGNNGGLLKVKGGSFWNRNLIDISGQLGGNLDITSQNIQNDGTINAQGTLWNGGDITFNYSGNLLGGVKGLIDASGKTAGGVMDFTGTGLSSEAYLSLTLNVSANHGTGGTVDIDTPMLYLTGATLKANGSQGGGNLFLGSDGPSEPVETPQTQIAYISAGTSLQANATNCGNGGSVYVDGTVLSQFFGTATANGAGSGSVGTISIEGPATAGLSTPASAARIVVSGKSIKALAIPASAVATGSGSSTGSFEFVDPDAGSGNAFGRPFVGVFDLSSNRTLITAPGDSFGGAGAGAVYLFSDTNGALISTLRGNQAGDAIGSSVQVFSDGNFAIKSPNWNDNMGAVTFGNGLTGFAGGSGFVSPVNSLVGSTSGDQVGSGGLYPLFNGTYLVLSPDWNNNAGAVTWVRPSVGVVGVVSGNNSLVGASANDSIGSGGIVQLSNGANFLVLSPNFNGDTGTLAHSGAITDGSDMTGIVGTVSSSNSLVGATAGDQVGSPGSITDTGIGYFLATTLGFDHGAGAVTWSNDSEAATGAVSDVNSLVGTSSGDAVGSGGITVMYGDHNYIVSSPNWGGGAGAVTLGDGSMGISGIVSSTNSYVGASAGDHIGSGGITDLFDNGAYVIDSPQWSGGLGAVTLANSTLGTSGVVGSGNSLVGTNSGDAIGSGGITILANGDFLVLSPHYNSNAGAVTWEDSTLGQAGAVSSNNSLVGANSGDSIGSGGIYQLSNNGNYLVLSPSWGGGKGAVTNGSDSSALTGTVDGATSLVGVSTTDHVGSAGSIIDSFDGYYLVDTTNFNNGGGAVTWNSDTAGATNVVSNLNSLVGASGDHLGSGGVRVLYNGDYIVISPNWNNQTGAVTWGSATLGVAGTISSTNSLVGSTSGDRVGSGGIVQLSNGSNYLVLSPNWSGGFGAITNVDPSAAIAGTVSGANSLVGSHAGDGVGSSGSVIDTFDGYYLVVTSNWNGGAGAVTWNNDDGGVLGSISETNSLVGSAGSDHLASGGVTVLFNDNYIVDSPDWSGNTGAVTWGNGSTGISGTINSTNSLVGANAGDKVGSAGIMTLSNNDYLVLSPDFGGNAGAVTWASGATGVQGVLTASNSLVGANAGDKVGSAGITILPNGDYLVVSPDFGGNAGAVTWGGASVGVSGVVSASNSLVGAAGDAIGSGGIYQLSNGSNYLVLSPSWGGGKGAVTNGSDSLALTGVVGASNSLVGASGGDAVGSEGSIIDQATGYYLVTTGGFNGGAGAVTWNSDSSGTTGVISSSNSLVGANSGDGIGDGGVQFLANGNYLVLSPFFDGGAGAVTFGSKSGGVSGVASASNSLVGSDSNDHIGIGGIIFLNNGNYLVQSPLYNNSAGAVTWGSGTTGVSGVVSSANSLTGGGPDSGEEYIGQSADGSIYIVAFTTDTSMGGDGRVVAGSVDGPGTTIATTTDFFLEPYVVSVEASEFGNAPTDSTADISNPNAIPLVPVSTDAITGGAINDGKGNNIAGGSSTSNAPGVHRLVTPGNGIWNIFGGFVHSAPPPAFIAHQLQINLSPQVLAHLQQILFGHP